MRAGKIHRGLIKLFFLALAALFFGACGLLVGEPFIDPVPEADITRHGNDRAEIYLRSYSPHDAFSQFTIFYRIYVSDVSIPATTTDTFPAINPILQQNFNSVYPFIDSDTLFGTNMHNLFSGINFRYLFLANAANLTGTALVEANVPVLSIDQVLGRSLFYRPNAELILEFDFSQSQQVPVLRIGSDEFILLRAESHPGIGSFNPRPEHRRFINHDDLREYDYINVNFNADVANRAGLTGIDRRFTYVAMFIVGVGMNPLTFANVYSTPSLIHVFQIPDP